MMQVICTKEQQLEANRRRWHSGKKFEYSISHKRKTNVTLVDGIKKFLAENYEVYLPHYYSDYRQDLAAIYKYDAYGEDLKDAYHQLAKLHYIIKDRNYSLGAAQITDERAAIETQPVMHLYSRNRLDQVWNFRKQHLIRSIYFHYIQEGLASGLFDNLLPVHITLTVPRDEKGEFQGQRFYGSRLLELFNSMRKTLFWKMATYGGEYGVETTGGGRRKKNEKEKKRKPGLHTHIHSFTLLHRTFQMPLDKEGRYKLPVKQMVEELRYALPPEEFVEVPKEGNNPYTRRKIKEKFLETFHNKRVTLNWFQNRLFNQWNELTNATQIWVEQLYCFKKNDAGEYITEYVPSNRPEDIRELLAEDEKEFFAEDEIYNQIEKGYAPELKKVRKKFRVDHTSSPEDYVAGVLECIKYHFKGDTFQDENGNYDYELMAEVLRETKGKRLYSRFGAFYANPDLNFSKDLHEDDEAEAMPADHQEDELMGKAANALQNIINPITFELAAPEDYCLALYKPEDRKHNSRYYQADPYTSREKDFSKFSFLSNQVPVSDILKAAMTNRIGSLYSKGNQETAYLSNMKQAIEKLRGYVGALDEERLTDQRRDCGFMNLTFSGKMRYLVEDYTYFLQLAGYEVTFIDPGDPIIREPDRAVSIQPKFL